jgi:hypothetical protein
MPLLSDGQFTLGLAQGRISKSTLPAGNGRTPCPDRGRGSPGLRPPMSRISGRAAHQLFTVSFTGNSAARTRHPRRSPAWTGKWSSWPRPLTAASWDARTIWRSCTTMIHNRTDGYPPACGARPRADMNRAWAEYLGE